MADKAAKKELKRKRAAEAAAAEAEAEAPAEDEVEAKRRRKEKKRAKKAAAAAAEEAAAAAAAEEEAAAKKERKRKRKAEKAAAAGKKSPRASPKATPKSSPKAAPKSPKAAPKSPKAAPKKISSAPTPEILKWREENRVTVDEKSVGIAPALKFSDSGLPAELLKCTAKFTAPSAIQAQSWPILMAGKDMIGISKTGSGKTFAFMLPALLHCGKTSTKKYGRTARALCVAPTRELCTQIAKEGELAGNPGGYRVVCLYGGVPKYTQRQQLEEGVDVIVATPGRLLDLAEEGVADLSQVSYSVLDEADSMLDMGFEPDVRRMFKKLFPVRQTVMFSATWPEAIQALAHEFLKDPARVVIGSENLQANRDITQVVEVVEDFQKFPRLLKLLEKYHGKRDNRILIFGLYKKECARLENDLNSRGWRSVAIHGDMTQAARNAAYERFKSGECPLCVATDVAARGLDIKGVEYVINVTFPLTVEYYVHRIGRTGRAGVPGHAHTFFTQHDKQLAPELIKVLEGAGQKVPEGLEKFRHVAPKKVAGANARHALESKSGGFKGDAPGGSKVTFDSDSD
eukprot:Hpha_TRINITY_DN7982_c0_g1::TRINITY_DN7982_c0_g1_i1::g.146191::m.146191/K14811/DBP3; ATP-dependent RNA helicase DBP3